MNIQKGSATTILLVVLVVVLAAVLVYFAFLKKPGEVAISPTPTATKTATPTPDKTANWRIWRLEGYNGYEFRYPKEFSLLEKLEPALFPVSDFTIRGGGPQVLVYLPSNAYSNTNFVRAYFSASRNGIIANLSDCKKAIGANGQTEELKSTQIINGITFYKGSYGGVALGTETESRVYRAFGGSGGDGCYELVLSLSTATPTGYEGKTVNKSEVWKRLESILSTFKFTK